MNHIDEYICEDKKMKRKGKYGAPAYIFLLIKRIMPVIIKGKLNKMLYQYLATKSRDSDLLFWNFGFAPLNPDAKRLFLKDSDEKNRLYIQLYSHVISAVNLKEKDVLEVGCGLGGGSSFIMKYHKPKSMIGIDFSEKAIDFCNSNHSIDGLSFSYGQAESLPFEKNTFDVVINLESSHCYGYMERFLNEVSRVLRLNGYLLIADFRAKDQISSLQDQLNRSDLKFIKEEIITPNVLKALELDNERKLELIHKKIPKLLNNSFKYWWGTKGSAKYELFNTGEEEYFNYVLQKLDS